MKEYLEVSEAFQGAFNGVSGLSGGPMRASETLYEFSAAFQEGSRGSQERFSGFQEQCKRLPGDLKDTAQMVSGEL